MAYGEKAALFRKFCKPRDVPGLPISLMQSALGNWELGNNCPAGLHDGGMAMWSTWYDGGRLLAEYILENPAAFYGKNVLDIGSGSGIVAIAAAKVGAVSIAIDSNPYATYANRVNARHNNVSVRAVTIQSIGAWTFSEAEIITAADIFYSNRGMSSIVSLLSDAAANGKTIYATSQDEDLSKLFAPTGIVPDVLCRKESGGVSFVKFDSNNCHGFNSEHTKSPVPIRAARRMAFPKKDVHPS